MTGNENNRGQSLLKSNSICEFSKIISIKQNNKIFKQYKMGCICLQGYLVKTKLDRLQNITHILKLPILFLNIVFTPKFPEILKQMLILK